MMEDDIDLMDDDFVFYSLLYTSITFVFAMAVLTKFLTNEFRFGFRSVLSLGILFIGESLCHHYVHGSTGVLIFGFGCLLVYSILPANHLVGTGKTVFITGCDSGFGNALAKKLDSSGMDVFAGCLFKNGPGAIGLQNNCSERLKVVELDVTSDKQIKDAFDYISVQVGSSGLWGLVNNAGVLCISELEMTPEKVLRNTMEVNLFGMIKVTQNFLPLIRKSKGRIVNVSSLAGKVGFEGLGPYCISKSAIESFTDVLRLEMNKWEVKVCTIQPAGFLTGSGTSDIIKLRQNDVWKQISPDMVKTYGKEYFDKLYFNFELGSQKLPTDLTPVTRAMKSALLSKRPMRKYIVGKGAWTFLTVYPVLPIWLSDYIAHNLGITTVVDVQPMELQQETRL